MGITFQKKDKDTLTVTTVTHETHIIEEDRAEIQTQIDHWEDEQVELQKKIDDAKAKIAILDA
jgi:predicted  nucleic acid-binding Zn-ribbon protein